MVYRHYVDISVAVATPKGLVVPVLRYQIKKGWKLEWVTNFRNVESMDYAQIEQALAALGEKVENF